jgi:hypothetical protein
MNESHVIPSGAASVPAMYDYSMNVGRGTLSSSGTNDKFSRRQFFVIDNQGLGHNLRVDEIFEHDDDLEST